MKEKLIELVEKDYLKSDIPQFKAGDTIAVHYRVKEGNKERIQVFEGVVIRVSGGSVAKNFTVRKVSSGIGVERIIPINSPLIGAPFSVPVNLILTLFSFTWRP